MKKTFLSFKSVTDVLKYIKLKRPTQYVYDPQGLRLTLTDSSGKKNRKRRRLDAVSKGRYLESLANLRIDLD